jgi:hypothetical protein
MRLGRAKQRSCGFKAARSQRLEQLGWTYIQANASLDNGLGTMPAKAKRRVSDHKIAFLAFLLP